MAGQRLKHQLRYTFGADRSSVWVGFSFTVANGLVPLKNRGEGGGGREETCVKRRIKKNWLWSKVMQRLKREKWALHLKDYKHHQANRSPEVRVMEKRFQRWVALQTNRQEVILCSDHCLHLCFSHLTSLMIYFRNTITFTGREGEHESLRITGRQPGCVSRAELQSHTHLGNSSGCECRGWGLCRRKWGTSVSVKSTSGNMNTGRRCRLQLTALLTANSERKKLCWQSKSASQKLQKKVKGANDARIPCRFFLAVLQLRIKSCCLWWCRSFSQSVRVN